MLAEAVLSSLSGLIPLLFLGAVAIALRLIWQGTTADWQYTTGSTLVAVALAMVLSLLLAHLPLRHPAPATATAPARHALPATPSSQPAAKQQRPAKTQQHAAAIKIIAFSNGRVSILENGKIYTLHLGEQSPGGWRLVSASTMHADLVRPDGKHYIYRP